LNIPLGVFNWVSKGLCPCAREKCTRTRPSEWGSDVVSCILSCTNVAELKLSKQLSLLLFCMKSYVAVATRLFYLELFNGKACKFLTFTDLTRECSFSVGKTVHKGRCGCLLLMLLMFLLISVVHSIRLVLIRISSVCRWFLGSCPLSPLPLVSFAEVIRVVTQRSSPPMAAHSSSAFLSLCYWEPITCIWLLIARQSYFSLHLPPKTTFLENGSLLLIGQFEERNAELKWAAIGGEDRCVTTLITAAKETTLPLGGLQGPRQKTQLKIQQLHKGSWCTADVLLHQGTTKTKYFGCSFRKWFLSGKAVISNQR